MIKNRQTSADQKKIESYLKEKTDLVEERETQVQSLTDQLKVA
jgi:hypothetical protein